MESISQKLHHGVVLNFKKIGSEQDGGGEEITPATRDNRGKSHEGSLPPDSNKIKNGESKKEEEEREVSPSSRANAWHNTRRMIYVRPNPKTNIPSGHWPIPESFWPDPSSSILVSVYHIGAVISDCILIHNVITCCVYTCMLYYSTLLVYRCNYYVHCMVLYHRLMV